MLAQAVAARSYEMIRNTATLGGGRERWGRVLAQWATDPDTDKAVGELLDIDHIGPSRSKTLTSMMLDRMRTSTPTPNELRDVADVHHLARQADAHLEEAEAPDPAGWFRFKQPLPPSA